MNSKSDVAVDVRPYREGDERGVLDLLSASLGGGPVGERRPEFFRWKHFDSPFGASFMLVAETDDRIVGLRAFMRWRFEDGTRILHAVRAVDTATHPDYQGRGIFSRLTKQALEELRGDVDLVFNTPNETSLRGYLKMGWDVVGKVPIWVKVRRPLRLMTRGRTIRETMDAPAETPHVHADSAEVGLGDGGEISSLLSRIKVEDGRLRTLEDVDFLRWRYGAAPFLDYRIVRDETGGDLRGLAIFRVRPRGRLLEATVAELIVSPGDGRSMRRLLRGVADACGVDHMTCRLPTSWPSGNGLRWGLLRAPEGLTFVVNPLRPVPQPDPTALGSWALSLGDLEVF